MIRESIWCAEGRPTEACIGISLDPGDWCIIRESKEWKAFLELLDRYESRDSLQRRLKDLDLEEKATNEQVQAAIADPVRPVTVHNRPSSATTNNEQVRRPILQRLKKWISGDASGS